ncbi:hypothetical protein [Ancylobacter sp.]|uniref:hypothetical protein n=1 Tax=Ancylobacter sp. TaxID=1872567 RepID=UPI003BAA9E8F
MSDTVTPPWTLTRVRQIDSDTGSLSLTLDGESTPKVEVTADGRATFNTSLAVTGPLLMEGPAMAHSGLSVTGDAKASGSIEAEKGLVGLGAVPVGAILMWSGDPAKLPEGWHLCNGVGWFANGDPVPDLRGRFIVGHDPRYADYAQVRTSGGSATRVLKVENLPSEEMLNLKQFIAARPIIDGDTYGLSRSVGRDVEVGSKGLSKPIDIRPPWYALAYIIYGGRGGLANVGRELRADQFLVKGQGIASPSGRYVLMLMEDDKLKLLDMKDKAQPKPIWVAKQENSDALGVEARMQSDGNFVMYTKESKPTFASNTYKDGGVVVRVTDEGTVRIDDAQGKSVWSKP